MRSAFRPVVGLFLLLPSLAAAEPLPSMTELTRLFDEGKYAAVLQKLPPVLALKGEAAKAYDLHDLLRLKGETHLRLGTQAAAVKAFAEAAAETKDAQAAGLDLAMALLVQRSGTKLAYTPAARTRATAGKPAAAPLPVVEPAARKAALAALLADEVAAAEPKVDAARRATDLPPVMAAFALLRDLKVLESAAVGGDGETNRLLGRLESGVGPLLSDAVRDAGRDLDYYEAHANQPSPYVRVFVESTIGPSNTHPRPKDMKANEALNYPGVKTPYTGFNVGARAGGTAVDLAIITDSGVKIVDRAGSWKRRGVMPSNARSLNDMIVRLADVTAACKALEGVTKSSPTDYATLALRSYEISRRADQLLGTDFSPIINYPRNRDPAPIQP